MHPFPQILTAQVPPSVYGANLGNINDDIMHLFGLLPIGQGQTVASKFAEFKQLIRTEAEAGALQAVPEIKAAVKQQVTPYIVAALALGIFGAVGGFIALRRTRNKPARKDLSMARTPSYLWPQDRRRQGGPFRDRDVERAAEEAAAPYAHLPLDEALRQIRKDREARGD